MIWRGWKRWKWFPCWEGREWPGSGRTVCVWMIRGKIFHLWWNRSVECLHSNGLDFETNLERQDTYTGKELLRLPSKENKVWVVTLVSTNVCWNKILSTSWNSQFPFLLMPTCSMSRKQPTKLKSAYTYNVWQVFFKENGRKFKHVPCKCSLDSLVMLNMFCLALTLIAIPKPESDFEKRFHKTKQI